MKTALFASLCGLSLHASHSVDLPAPVRPLVIPVSVALSNQMADLRSSEGSKAFPVAPGVQITARIKGTMPMPVTDPGRTRVQIELALPLLAKDGRTILLPAGTCLVGQVHLLRGELRFVDFQSCFLPDGRGVRMTEQTFLLGPGPLLALQDGTPALLTVARPLKMEAFDSSPDPSLRASIRP